MRFSADFRSIARRALKNNYWLAVLVTLVASVLGAAVHSGIAVGTGARYSKADTHLAEAIRNSPYAKPIMALIVVALVSAAAYALVRFLIGGAIRVGLCHYYTDLVSERKSAFSTLFKGFDVFGKTLGLRLWTMLLTFAWSLLLIVPGIVAAFRYSMAPYIMAEDPSVGVREAVDRSKKMMSGNKWRLFKLYLSFIGWYILCAFTCGIGYVFLAPYVEAAVTAFYFEVSGQTYKLEACSKD